MDVGIAAFLIFVIFGLVAFIILAAVFMQPFQAEELPEAVTILSVNYRYSNDEVYAEIEVMNTGTIPFQIRDVLISGRELSDIGAKIDPPLRELSFSAGVRKTIRLWIPVDKVSGSEIQIKLVTGRGKEVSITVRL